uniref:Metallophosphoesterase n=1 Tax=Leptospirillum ferriphilum TaxID=178606 RepID=A0A7C3LUF7_9BACT
MSTYVVGDLHGQLHLLKELMEQIRFDPRNDRLISVGDVIDRGTDTGALLDTLFDAAESGWFSAIKGNHEELLLAYHRSPELFGSDYLDPGFGGRPTLAALERSKRGKSMLSWIETWPLFLEAGDFILVHGSLPRIRGSAFGDIDLCALRQDPQTGFHSCLWARPPELYPSFDQREVVSGHNIVSRPGTIKDGLIMIDTGAYRSGILTMIRLDDRSFHQVKGKPRVEN